MKFLALIALSFLLIPFIIVGMICFVPVAIGCKILEPVAQKIWNSYMADTHIPFKRWLTNPKPPTFRDNVGPWTALDGHHHMTKDSVVCFRETPERAYVVNSLRENGVIIDIRSGQEERPFCSLANDVMYSNDGGQTWLPCGTIT